MDSGSTEVYFLCSTGSLGAGSLMWVGSMPQISRAYCVMVRSLENLPDAAMFIRHLWAHFSWSCDGQIMERSYGTMDRGGKDLQHDG